MRMIRPKLVAPQVTIAEEQDEFKPVTAAVVRHPDYSAVPTAVSPDKLIEANSMVMAFLPSPAELRRLAEGEPLYLSMLTFMQPMQGFILSVGSSETAGMYGLEVEPS